MESQLDTFHYIKFNLIVSPEQRFMYNIESEADYNIFVLSAYKSIGT